MKKQRRHTELYKLPNHHWSSAEIFPTGSKYDTPEIVVRRTDYGVLTRNSTWEQAKNPRYNWSKEFCGETNPNDTWDSQRLWIVGTSIIGILAQRARDGNTDAAQELARLASESTVQLTKICKAKPDLVWPLSKYFRAWPVIKKKNAKLSNEEMDLFAAIQLGANDFIELHAQTAKWKLDDAGKIAYSLLNYIRVSRGSPPHGFDNGAISKFVKEKLPRDFADENADDWWNVAKDIFLFSYPQPHAIDELKSLTPATSKGRQKSPGRLDEDIFRKLKSRFMAFARAKVR